MKTMIARAQEKLPDASRRPVALTRAQEELPDASRSSNDLEMKTMIARMIARARARGKNFQMPVEDP